MVVACGLDYKMLDEEQQASVLRIVGQHLLTPKGCVRFRPAILAIRTAARAMKPFVRRLR